jgi:TRAP transporter TAXI family solute receptor
MKKGTLILLVTALVTLCFLGTKQNAKANQNQTYILATASKGGTYWPVGKAIETLTQVKLAPINHYGLKAINSAGSGENIKLLRENKAQFAILQGLFGHYAWSGTGPLSKDGPQKEIRSITMLWKNVEHFTILKKLMNEGTISDMGVLKGKTMSLGKKNSGTIGSNTILLNNLGIDVQNSYELVYAGYGQSVKALRSGQIIGMGTPAGIPTKAVEVAMRSMGDKLCLLSFTEEQAAQADGGIGLWTPYIIPGGTYPGQDADVTTIAQPNFLAVRADMDEEKVYQITKLLFENLRFLQNIHSATNEMHIKRALQGLPLPLHPGAARYFKEVGLAIPQKLLTS